MHFGTGGGQNPPRRLGLDVHSINGTHIDGNKASVLQSYKNIWITFPAGAQKLQEDGAGGGRGRPGDGCSQANVSSVLLRRRDGPCGLEKKEAL